MGSLNDPPDGGQQDQGGGARVGAHGDRSEAVQGKLSYSDRLKTNVRYDQKFKRNLLEITLEKTDLGADINTVDGEDIARVLKTLGIDVVTQTQGYQVHYKGKFSIISVWMAAGIPLDRFCKDINIKVVDGVMTGMIRPAGKTDMTVKVEGLDFNSLVIEYLGKFGTVKSNTVIYAKYETGLSRVNTMVSGNTR